MNFQLEKKNALTKKDKSNENQIDKKILSLVNKINKTRNFFTTSSCAGRITIIPKTNKKTKNAFLFKSHDPITLNQLKKIIASNFDLPTSNLYFRAEPAALHIKTTSLENAQTLLNIARNAGFKKSGIISSKSHFTLELFATESLITPITKNIPDTYLALLVKEANEKLKQTQGKIKRLKKALDNLK